MEVEQWWRSNGGGGREREKRRFRMQRETDGETNNLTPNVERERERERERVRRVFLWGLEIGMALMMVINQILLKIFVIMDVFF